MAKVDLYPTKNAPPSQAEVQTGTVDGQKVGADTFIIGGSIIAGSAAAPADYDSATVGYPNAITEIYTYSKSAVVVKVVTITYTDATKANIAGWTIA